MRKAAPESFDSVLRAITTNRCVEVPAAVGRSLAINGRAPVRARILGIEFNSTLLPSRSGGHRLFVPSAVWKTRGIAVGDSIPVEMWRVPEEPVTLPAELAPFAKSSPAIAAAYARMTPADRRQIAKYLESARTADTLERRAAEIARRLLSPPRRAAKKARP